jgi:hypothetical protein
MDEVNLGNLGSTVVVRQGVSQRLLMKKPMHCGCVVYLRFYSIDDSFIGYGGNVDRCLKHCVAKHDGQEWLHRRLTEAAVEYEARSS